MISLPRSPLEAYRATSALAAGVQAGRWLAYKQVEALRRAGFSVFLCLIALAFELKEPSDAHLIITVTCAILAVLNYVGFRLWFDYTQWQMRRKESDHG